MARETSEACLPTGWAGFPSALRGMMWLTLSWPLKGAVAAVAAGRSDSMSCIWASRPLGAASSGGGVAGRWGAGAVCWRGGRGVRAARLGCLACLRAAAGFLEAEPAGREAGGVAGLLVVEVLRVGSLGAFWGRLSRLA